jgi:hypothetical protein
MQQMNECLFVCSNVGKNHLFKEDEMKFKKGCELFHLKIHFFKKRVQTFPAIKIIFVD